MFCIVSGDAAISCRRGLSTPASRCSPCAQDDFAFHDSCLHSLAIYICKLAALIVPNYTGENSTVVLVCGGKCARERDPGYSPPIAAGASAGIAAALPPP